MTDTPQHFAPAAFLHLLGGHVTAMPVPQPGNGTLLEIGTFAGLPVWSASGPAAMFATQARRLARAGQIGLLLGGREENGRMPVAITLAPVRTVFLSSTGTESPIIRRLHRAATAGTPSLLGTGVALADALDLDAAGRRTFRLMHALIERGVAHLPATIPHAERHSWLLTQCTRLLFLRFVEAEGWLDQDDGFLLRHFDRCLHARRDPFRSYLQPLFFGTLNRPVGERLRTAREFGAIPFLNGGLFEPHPVEERHHFDLPVSWWREAFAALAERIDVTLDPEAAGGEVTPEMLGRVFEGVMAADERKATGAFYTPAPLVRGLIRAALIPLLAERLHRGEEAIDRLLDDPDPPLRRALTQLRLLDPAVGSGAFLVGALDLLHGPGARESARVRHLVTHALFGIDCHPGAVRITELRLWLEVLRPLRGATPGQIPPLPNLDAAVRAGDALVDPLRGTRPRGDLQPLLRQHRALAQAHGGIKRRLLAAMRAEERATVLASLTEQEERLDRVIGEIVEEGKTTTLFGERRGLLPAQQTSLRALRQRQHDIRREARAIARDERAAPFAPAIAFAPTMQRRGGFDLVMGNPPWVRAERLPVAMRQALGERYRWWKSSGARGYQHLPDLAVAFVERGLELVRPGGTLAMLLPAKLATSQYASVMRDGLAHRTTLHCVADLANDPRATFQATTYPMALVASRTAPPSGHQVRLGLLRESSEVAQREWQGSATWPLHSPGAHAVALKLARRHPSLGDQCTAQLGVKTGANDLFLNPPESLAQWTRPAVRGRDLAGGPARTADRLLWPADDHGVPWPILPPAVEEYLAPHRERLERRADLHDSCWWRLFRTGPATAAHRVAWSDLARTLAVTHLTDPRAIPLNSCYLIGTRHASEAAALAAWLGSSWLRALARLHADPAAQGYARFNARVVAALPLPASALATEALRHFHPADSSAQYDLDLLVGDLLHLDHADRALLAPLAADRR